MEYPVRGLGLFVMRQKPVRPSPVCVMRHPLDDRGDWRWFVGILCALQLSYDLPMSGMALWDAWVFRETTQLEVYARLAEFVQAVTMGVFACLVVRRPRAAWVALAVWLALLGTWYLLEAWAACQPDAWDSRYQLAEFSWSPLPPEPTFGGALWYHAQSFPERARAAVICAALPIAFLSRRVRVSPWVWLAAIWAAGLFNESQFIRILQEFRTSPSEWSLWLPGNVFLIRGAALTATVILLLACRRAARLAALVAAATFVAFAWFDGASAWLISYPSRVLSDQPGWAFTARPYVSQELFKWSFVEQFHIIGGLVLVAWFAAYRRFRPPRT